jgi:hypothetical protein
MNGLLERIVVAVEQIAAALTARTTLTPAPSEDAPAPETAQRGRPRKDPAPVAAAPEKPKAEPAKLSPEKPKAAPEKPKADAIPVAQPPSGDASFPYERLKKALIDLAQLGPEGAGRKAAIDLLSRFGVQNAKDAPPERWEEMFDVAIAEFTRLTSPPDDFT